MIRPLLISLGVVAILYVLAIVALVLAGRRTAAREMAALLPNLALLFKDLIRDPRVPRSSKALLLVGIAWIASPIDLIPEFIPFLGPLDDAVVTALILRRLVKTAGPQVVEEHWRGDQATITRLLGRRGARPPGQDTP
jgi:uncharacterized membrane protein YkvA (DUF1232 family)